jgi:hypothetical protein
MASAYFQRNVNYVFGSDFHDERGRRKKGRVLRSQSQSQSQFWRIFGTMVHFIRARRKKERKKKKYPAPFLFI